MSRKQRGRSKSAPSYRLHKRSGQAIVTIRGKMHYLGKFDSEESHQAYKRLLLEKWSGPGEDPKPETEPVEGPVTISHLAIEFGKAAKKKYGEKPEWNNQIRPVLKIIRATYGDLEAAEFGPARFEAYRQDLVRQGLSRAVVKRKSNYVLRMFQHGVKFELIPVELWQRLLSVGPVEMDRKPTKVRPVAIELVKATQEQLTPLLSDMVELQRLIGARPSEVCNMRPGDIDRSGDVWIYKPAKHKTEHHGHSRFILIGPKAQAILAKYLFRDPASFCFTPAEAYDQHMQQRREARTTPENQGNGPGPRKRQKFKPCYDHNSYRRAIQRAALRAFPYPAGIKGDQEKIKAWEADHVWKPNQLRHSAATSARQECDLETAQILLGHSSKATTEKFYAEVDTSRAIEFARKHG